MSAPMWMLFFVAALSGSAVAAFEVLRVFKHELKYAFRVGWSWFLVLTHGLLALLFFYLICNTNPQLALLPVALLVGFALPTLIRSRFTFFMPISETDIDGRATRPISLELDTLYQGIQSFCREQIDRNLLKMREDHVRKLVDRYKLKELAAIAQRTVNLRQHMDDLKKRQKYPRKVMTDKKSSDREKAEILAYFIVRISSTSYVEGLCRKSRERHK